MLSGFDVIQKGEDEEEEVGEEEHQEHLEVGDKLTSTEIIYNNITFCFFMKDYRLDPDIPVNQFIIPFKKGKDDRHKM